MNAGMETLRRRAAPLSGGLALLGSLTYNALQYQTQQSEGQRCQEIVLAQQTSYTALQQQCVQAILECRGSP